MDIFFRILYIGQSVNLSYKGVFMCHNKERKRIPIITITIIIIGGTLIAVQTSDTRAPKKVTPT